MFDSNCMHVSNGNVTPYPRSNLFVVFNSVENACVEPFAAPAARPAHLGARDHSPVWAPRGIASPTWQLAGPLPTLGTYTRAGRGPGRT
ncbi:hypothetical protein [Ornithinimicrobium cavernae]|uniref:hypothetical protein n=1 Tax=Ornithinimicrobium cavernae TaxID=2666047 RepID=UPI001F1C91BF|nr:hypothetical protein [Ornithinimicrobium cavernae]